MSVCQEDLSCKIDVICLIDELSYNHHFQQLYGDKMHARHLLSLQRSGERVETSKPYQMENVTGVCTPYMYLL